MASKMSADRTVVMLRNERERESERKSWIDCPTETFGSPGLDRTSEQHQLSANH